MLVTDTGTTIAVSPIQSWKALAPIVVRVLTSSNVTDIIPVLRNKLALMVVVVLGIITPSPWKALAPMNVTDAGMTVSINEVP